MEFFRIKKDIPFMRHALIFNVISAVTFLAAVFFLVHKGLHLSVEFKGGTLMEVKYPKAANLEGIRGTLIAMGYEEPGVTSFDTARDVMIRLPVENGVSAANTSQRVFESLCKAEQGTTKAIDTVTAKGEHVLKSACMDTAGNEAVVLQKVEFVGPQVGEELAQNGLNALVVVIIGVMIYLAIRFEWKYAVSAIIANLHDVVIILGFFAFFEWEFSLTVLAAILAVLGYSVNESVVIFDRIRENFRKQRKASVHEVIDNAITSTISRTIITHGSTQMMVLSMLVFGGQTLHHFALALTIGICFGIYSSVFVAASIAMWLGVKREDLIKPIKEKDETDGAVV
ncbi:protein-export membrane protein SecF [Janthinobacterium sp. HH103]|uniref:Protein-export membrane protein SecF n=1 Tax=Janthinobacterium agaricidamnosum TaxID=55508 RepID=A0A3G2EH20_9BURK|nr:MULTISPECIES: protein translocase subunit SecF [Janthinobacterium]AYM78709.1 protein translocase subunit SecF [Janthinobacterium agaricidamnosum]MCC7679342.1 protein translocase subunit SecF [Janthinobacterium sp. FW305-128]OEZ53745.1 protein-export membrane protein SecF [Janthinobacterium sp. HH100]OEZ78810.1 protein-export membrane protein SecF [Janthinobacterium sp. HH103]OEZ85368.1 protein-export membrane protein SecF [Janthinobacterium sp. HH106]